MAHADSPQDGFMSPMSPGTAIFMETVATFEDPTFRDDMQEERQMQKRAHRRRWGRRKVPDEGPEENPAGLPSSWSEKAAFGRRLAHDDDGDAPSDNRRVSELPSPSVNPLPKAAHRRALTSFNLDELDLHPTIAKQGWLKSFDSDAWVFKWRRRWCLLRQDNTFSLFVKRPTKPSKATPDRALCTVDLSFGVQAIQSQSIGDKENAIEIVIDAETSLTLAAESREEHVRWLRLLENAHGGIKRRYTLEESQQRSASVFSVGSAGSPGAGGARSSWEFEAASPPPPPNVPPPPEAIRAASARRQQQQPQQGNQRRVVLPAAYGSPSLSSMSPPSPGLHRGNPEVPKRGHRRSHTLMASPKHFTKLSQELDWDAQRSPSLVAPSPQRSQRASIARLRALSNADPRAAAGFLSSSPPLSPTHDRAEATRKRLHEAGDSRSYNMPQMRRHISMESRGAQQQQYQRQQQQQQQQKRRGDSVASWTTGSESRSDDDDYSSYSESGTSTEDSDDYTDDSDSLSDYTSSSGSESSSGEESDRERRRRRRSRRDRSRSSVAGGAEVPAEAQVRGEGQVEGEREGEPGGEPGAGIVSPAPTPRRKHAKQQRRSSRGTPRRKARAVSAEEPPFSPGTPEGGRPRRRKRPDLAPTPERRGASARRPRRRTSTEDPLSPGPSVGGARESSRRHRRRRRRRRDQQPRRER